MNNEEFAVAKGLLNRKCNAVLKSRQSVYASEVDRLHNFKVQAALRGTTIIDAIGGNAGKQIASVFDLIERETHTEEQFPMDMWEEKIVDAINYLTLLYAALLEERS